MPTELPDHIKEAIQRQTLLRMTLEGILLTNIYGTTVEYQIKLNTQKVQVQRELAEVTGVIQRYIDEGIHGTS
jgi:hypothetical protein